MTGLLDLNDASLALWSGDAVLHSPGYARWHDDRYQFGLGAQAEARLHPRQLSTRYWAQLSLQPLVPALGPARHSADLVHTQLQDMLTQQPANRLLLAVPGHFSREQLSLLLGILQTLPTEVAGIVHRSAAIAAQTSVDSGCHIELQLQQTVLTPLSLQGETVVAGDSQTVPGFGWLWLLDRLADAVAAQFVEQTRFDPQRKASSEQTLYDELPALLAAIAENSEYRLEIDGYTARLQRDQLSPVGQQWRAELERVTDARQWLLRGDLETLPGLANEGLTLIPEQHDWPARTLAQAEDFIDTAGELHLQRQVALDRSPRLERQDLADDATNGDASDATATDEPLPDALPTHLLRDHHATLLCDGLSLSGDAQIRMETTVPRLGSDVAPDLLVNGQQASPGQVLRLGDTLSDSLGFTARLIRVED